MKRRGAIFILSSPSGCGKSTLLAMARERLSGLTDSVSYTTRPPRPGEANGVHYHFVDAGTFRRRTEEGFFAEWARVHDQWYGTSRVDLEAILARGDDAVMDIDIQGARQLKKAFAEAVGIFILPPARRELELRLRGRGTEDEGAICRRLDVASVELEAAPEYDYVVVNDDLERAAGDLEAIITAERLRVSRLDLREYLDRLREGD
jgi:guanylate kinase